MSKIHEGEVIDPEGLVVREEQEPDVDWGPRPGKSARTFRADGSTRPGPNGRQEVRGCSLTEQEHRFLIKLTAWIAARRVLNNNGPDRKQESGKGGGRAAVFPNLGHAVGYMISAYGAMLDREMRDAGVDPETGYELKALPEKTK